MSIYLERKTFIGKLPELLDEGIFTACSKEMLNYDAGMNFLGALGEHPNHQLSDRNVKIFCAWDGEVSQPLKWDDVGVKRQPNILYDYNGSGEHFQNNDPRYLLPIGSNGLLLNKIEFLDSEAEKDFWLSRQNFLAKLFFKLKSRKRQDDWIRQKTIELNAALSKEPKQISVNAPEMHGGHMAG